MKANVSLARESPFSFPTVVVLFSTKLLLVGVIFIIIIIIIERKDLGGVMSRDCKDTVQAKNSDRTRVRRKVKKQYLYHAQV